MDEVKENMESVVTVREVDEVEEEEEEKVRRRQTISYAEKKTLSNYYLK